MRRLRVRILPGSPQFTEGPRCNVAAGAFDFMGLGCRPWPDLVASIAAVAEFGENEEKVLDRDNAIQIDVCGACGLTAEFAEHEKHVTDGDHAVQIQVLWA